MLKFICLSFMFLIISLNLNSQVYYDGTITEEVYFGPENVYPLSEGICNSYIEYLTYVKDETNKNDNKTSDLAKFTVNIDLLISHWIDSRSKIDSLVSITNLCFQQNHQNKIYKENHLELIVGDVKKLTEVNEYIDFTIINLDTIIWEERIAPNCQSTNPKDCIILCPVTVINSYLDFNNTELESNMLLEQLTRDEKTGRYTRALDIELQEDIIGENYSLYNDKLDLTFSIMTIEKRQCEGF